jgi:nitric oxide reductase NorD protein
MEEWVGLQWHRWVMRRAEPDRPGTAYLADHRRAVELLLHAGGGTQRVAEAAPMRVGGERSFWQRVAGSGLRLPLPQLDAQVLALPAQVALCDDAALNADLYRWWAALASQLDPALPWAQANAEAIPRVLTRFPGLAPRWQRLHTALGMPMPPPGTTPAQAAPCWTWIVPVAHADAARGDAAAGPDAGAGGESQSPPSPRRRTRRAEEGPARTPLLLASKSESLLTFGDPLRVDRAFDDEDDGSAATAAEELETLTLQQVAGPTRARWRFDLDLPSAAADDRPLGAGESLPEWDPRSRTLRADRVHAQVYLPRDPAPWTPQPALRATAARVRRQLERQRDALRWSAPGPDGERLDLDAWVRHRGENAAAHGPEAAVWQRRVRHQRDLATLLMADLSMSTDAHANDRQRVIDVIREALYVFGEALAGSGDPFAVYGFSSLRRQLRLHALKPFNQRWGPTVLPRLGALKPGYYTRMGAALRAATRRLQVRPERKRLLLLLTDGKPHDVDGYDSAWGLEDTRQAVLEARRAGLLPFALSIDAEAGETLPRLFGDAGWAAVRRPEELATRLATLHARLAR